MALKRVPGNFEDEPSLEPRRDPFAEAKEQVLASVKNATPQQHEAGWCVTIFTIYMMSCHVCQVVSNYRVKNLDIIKEG